jgi:hypothetical protein
MRYKIGDIIQTNLGEIEIMFVADPGYYSYQLNGQLRLLIRPFEQGYIPINW